MAALDPPPALKKADSVLFKCANRAKQLRNQKPIIAYWCDYWIVNQVLAQGLHTSDQDIMAYTFALMNNLEEFKKEHADEAAITDDTTGKAYIATFAQETLDRAQKVVMANRVTVNTANTFDAAATFLNLANIWGPADNETRQKIKYAKWSAVRIYKAIRDGVDPNDSNPKPEEAELDEETEAAADPADAEPLASPSVAPQPVSVEDLMDSESVKNVVSLPDTPAAVPSPQVREDVSLPDAPPDVPSASEYYAPQPPQQQPGYFDSQGAPPPPAMPSPMSPPLAPSAPSDLPQAWTPSPPPSAGTPFAPPSPLTQAPQDAPTTTAPPTFAPSSAATPAVAPPPISPPPAGYMDMAPNPAITRPAIPSPSVVDPGAVTPQLPPQSAPAPSATPVAAAAPPATRYKQDPASLALAQKHSRFAISAMHFEDSNTAVAELRRALAVLGAT